MPSRAVILTLSHPRQGGLSSAENHQGLHRAKKATFSPAERARGRTKRARMPPRVLSNETYTQPVGPHRTLVDRSSAPVVVHAAALNEVHHAAGRIWQREGGILMSLRRRRRPRSIRQAKLSRQWPTSGTSSGSRAHRRRQTARRFCCPRPTPSSSHPSPPTRTNLYRGNRQQMKVP